MNILLESLRELSLIKEDFEDCCADSCPCTDRWRLYLRKQPCGQSHLQATGNQYSQAIYQREPSGYGLSVGWCNI